MAISPQIAAFKSAGVYRLEFDKSQTVTIPAEQLRLVVGFSRKGPFNTPVFVPDSGFFKTVFGDINRADERKQSFFHRSCLAALERGPILALNLLRLDNATDGTGDYNEAFLFSNSSTEANEGYTSEALYSGYYNQDKFWYPENQSFLNNIGATEDLPFNKLFNLVNLNQRPITVLVRKADTSVSTMNQFMVTATDWYGAANVPSYLNPESFIADFMVDVFIFEGNFGGDASAVYPYERFAADPTFASYFDKQKGLIRKASASDTTDTKVEQFVNLPQVNLIASYTGTFLPDFVDNNGNNLFLETLINTDTPATGLFCAINTAMFDQGEVIDGVDKGLDLVGHELERLQPQTIDFLSYKDTIVADLDYTDSQSTIRNAALTGASIVVNSSGDVDITISKSTNLALYNIINAMTANVAGSARTVGTYVLTVAEDFFVPVISKTVTAQVAQITLSGAGGITNSDFSGTLKWLNPVDLDFFKQKDGNSGTIIGGPASNFYSDCSDGILTDGDKAVYGSTLSASSVLYLDFNISESDFIYYDDAGDLVIEISDSDYALPVFEVNAFENSDFTSPITTDADFGINQAGEFFFNTSDVAYGAGVFGVETFKGSLNQTVEVLETSSTPGSSLKPNQVIVSADYADVIAVGNYIIQNPGNSQAGESSRLTYITEVVGLSNWTNTNNVVPQNALRVTCVGEIYINTLDTIEVYQPITSWVSNYNLFTLNGFSLGSYNLPDGTNEQQNNILYDTLSGTKLYNALIDKDNITYRYIVDTFGNGIEANSKAILFQLAKARENAFFIANAPSVADFKKSNDPFFKNLLGQFDTKFVAEGGDLSKNPTIRYSLPSITQGSSYGAFYFPYLVVRENGSNISVPPAAYVSNNYIDKYATALPWSIVAGNRRGIVGGRGVVGVEYNLGKIDRDYVEPFGLNPIIFQNGTGLVIFGNKSAQQNVQSALSSAHVRELMIYIQDGLAAILKNYLFEFNTAQTRLEITTLANNFMTTVQSENGVLAFRNVMDETNNTADVIERNVGILDTFVEPVKGLEILVTRTTILRPGQITSGQ